MVTSFLKIFTPKTRTFAPKFLHMKRLSLSNLLLFSLLGLMLTSCDPDDETPFTYNSGVLVVNEGPFQTGTGTITYFNQEKDTLLQDIFSITNGGASLGNIVQSLTVIGDEAYIVVNNAGKIVVVDAETFVFKREITGFELPRYIVDAGNGKAFVTQWGSDGLTGAVKVIDLAAGTITNTIATGQGPETMLKDGNTVYVCNSGGFGRDSTIVAIDISSEAITDRDTVGDNPENIIKSQFSGIWVLCRGHSDWSNPALNTPGSVWPLGADLPVFYVGNGTSSLVSDAFGNMFFLDNGNLVKATLSDRDTLAQSFNYYSLGFDAKTNRLYVADAGDFASAGEVKIWQSSQSGVDSLTKFRAGIIPSAFWFGQ